MVAAVVVQLVFRGLPATMIEACQSQESLGHPQNQRRAPPPPPHPPAIPRWAMPPATSSTLAKARALLISRACQRGSSRCAARGRSSGPRHAMTPPLQDVHTRLPLYLEAPSQVSLQPLLPALGAGFCHQPTA